LKSELKNKIFINKKNKKEYLVTGLGLDVTENKDVFVVIYIGLYGKEKMVFIRNYSEFLEKFEQKRRDLNVNY
jgi:hypothetical protein